jgi:hypothetical protein
MDWIDFVQSKGQWLQALPRLSHLVLESKEAFSWPTINQMVQKSAYPPTPSITRLHLIGSLPLALLSIMQLPALEILQLDCNQANLYSIEGNAHKDYARTAKTLVLQGNPFRYSNTNWSLETAAKFIAPLKELATIIISRSLWDRTRSQIGETLTPTITTLDGEEVYQVRASDFTGELENFLKRQWCVKGV